MRFAWTILIAAALCGCDDNPSAPRVGVITIDPDPDSVSAPWQLADPGGGIRAGAGDTTLTGMAAGDYTLTWGPVAGWVEPAPSAITRTLAAAGTLTFTASFAVRAGTITIDAAPDPLAAPWQLDGPGGFRIAGVGDAVLEGLDPGNYALTWGDVFGWTALDPGDAVQALAAEGALTFTRTYMSQYALIPAGTFVMGSPVGEPGRFDNETQHQVTLSRAFQLKPTEVTIREFTAMAQWALDHGYATATSEYLYDHLDGSTVVLRPLGGSWPSEISLVDGVLVATNPDHAVTHVTWTGAVAYCDWLSLRQGLPRAYDHASWLCHEGFPYTAAGYRLPTEAEWEYACRAGSAEAFANGPVTYAANDCNGLDANLERVGWYCANSRNGAHSVALKLPNAWGLYDMHGGVMEWCNDRYATYGGATTDPAGPVVGGDRVQRGGDKGDWAKWCRSAIRVHAQPDDRGWELGFRVARTAD